MLLLNMYEILKKYNKLSFIKKNDSKWVAVQEKRKQVNMKMMLTTATCTPQSVWCII